VVATVVSAAIELVVVYDLVAMISERLAVLLRSSLLLLE
jgi:hypothetical protein